MQNLPRQAASGKRQAASAPKYGRISARFVMVSDDARARMIYPADAGNSSALLDAVLHLERARQK